MFARICVAALTAILLAACARESGPPDGSAILDERVALNRAGLVDSARREIAAHGDSIIVAFADEQLTDVKLQLATAGSNKDAATPVEVENNLQGAGALAVPAGSRVVVTLTGARDATAPGAVNLRVQQFHADSGSHSAYAARIAAYRAWSSATDANIGIDAVKATALPAMANAIAALELAEPALSAHAHHGAVACVFHGISG